MLAVLLVWLPCRVNSRYHLSSLSFEDMSNVSSLIFILHFNFLFASLCLRLSSGRRLIFHHIRFLFP
jgi:hypothetical protein